MDVVERGEFLRVFDGAIQDCARKARLLSNDIPTIRKIDREGKEMRGFFSITART